MGSRWIASIRIQSRGECILITSSQHVIEEDVTRTIQIAGVILLLFLTYSAIVTFASSSDFASTLPFALLIYGTASAFCLWLYRGRWKRVTISTRGIEFQDSSGRHTRVSWDAFDWISLKGYGSYTGIYFTKSDNFLDIKFYRSGNNKVVYRMKMRFWDKSKTMEIIHAIRENAVIMRKQIEQKTKHLKS